MQDIANNKDEVRIIPVHRRLGIRNLFNSIPNYFKILEYEYVRDKFKGGVPVFVIDNGIDETHEDSRGLFGYMDFTGEGRLPADHGTHVDDTVSGKYSLSEDTPTWHGKSLKQDGGGRFSDVADATNYVKSLKGEIIQMSMGSDSSSDLIKSCFEEFTSDGKSFVVVAAGNDGFETDFPAAYAKDLKGVISVGAADIRDLNTAVLSDYSSPGVVTVCFQGDNVKGAATMNRYIYLSGTSMAAPGVSSLISKAKFIKPDFTHDEFHRIAKISSIDMNAEGTDNETGYGFLVPRLFLENVERLEKGTHMEEYCYTDIKRGWLYRLFSRIFK